MAPAMSPSVVVCARLLSSFLRDQLPAGSLFRVICDMEVQVAWLDLDVAEKRSLGKSTA